MKFLAIILAAIGSAVKDHKFPDDDLFHAKCHNFANLKKTSCSKAYEQTLDLITKNVDTDSEYKGTMFLHSQEPKEWIRSQRLTYNKKYTDQ